MWLLLGFRDAYIGIRSHWFPDLRHVSHSGQLHRRDPLRHDALPEKHQEAQDHLDSRLLSGTKQCAMRINAQKHIFLCTHLYTNRHLYSYELFITPEFGTNLNTNEQKLKHMKKWNVRECLLRFYVFQSTWRRVRHIIENFQQIIPLNIQQKARCRVC